jgi:IclR family KDG regulon transcriptional repressor
LTRTDVRSTIVFQNDILNNGMNKTLIKDIGLLEALVTAGKPCTVLALARQLELQPSNVHRTLQTWVALGFVTQSSQTGAYQCTLKLFEWGNKVAKQFDVRQVASLHLQRLAEYSQETIHLAVLDGAEIIYLDKIDSPQPVRAYSEVGGRAPAHCVATGKALLASSDESIWKKLPTKLARFTPNTITSVAALRRECERTREKGYAINAEEWREGVSGLGAVITGHAGIPLAAVGLTSPVTRMGKKRMNELATAVRVTAEEISRAMGGAR